MSRRKSEYRAIHRERHRHAVFITEYTRRKCISIYEEANKLYEQLSKQYPTKTKLTTCPEFKIWEKSLQKDRTPTAPADISSEQSIQLNIPLMNANDVQETQDSLMFADVYPSLMEEINHEVLEQVMNEIRESDDVNIQVMDSTQMQDTPVIHDMQSSMTKEIRESDDVNIQVMDSTQMQDTPVIHDMQPSMTKEINIAVDEIIKEIERFDDNIFTYDQDINDMVNIEISNMVNELTPLERELLKY